MPLGVWLSVLGNKQINQYRLLFDGSKPKILPHLKYRNAKTWPGILNVENYNKKVINCDIACLTHPASKHTHSLTLTVFPRFRGEIICIYLKHYPLFYNIHGTYKKEVNSSCFNLGWGRVDSVRTRKNWKSDILKLSWRAAALFTLFYPIIINVEKSATNERNFPQFSTNWF